MHAIYAIVSGPLAWTAFGVFTAGVIFRLIRLYLSARRTEPFIFSYLSLKYSLRSIFHWLVPFGTVNWRLNPGMTVVTFVFHISLLITPFFLLSHVVLLDEAFSVSWWTLPDVLADLMTLIVMLCCLYFAVRRRVAPQVRFVTDSSDYVILALTAAPFLTGFIAYHQWFDYSVFMILHMLSAEILLMAIPFTRLSHMIFSIITRGYMGSEFGKVRHARDW